MVAGQEAVPGPDAAAPAAAASPAALAAEILASIATLPSRSAPALRALRRELSQRLQGRQPADVLAVAWPLVRRGGAAFRFVAYELIADHRPTLANLDASAVERLGEGIASWGEVDCFGCLVAGPAWRDRQVPDATILRWARSSDRWWRRAALVATVPLNARSRGGGGDSERTLMVCGKLVADRDDMVVKALSWSLRELAKRDPGAVAAFLRDEGDRLAARVRREVTLKLTTGRKQPRPRPARRA